MRKPGEIFPRAFFLFSVPLSGFPFRDKSIFPGVSPPGRWGRLHFSPPLPQFNFSNLSFSQFRRALQPFPFALVGALAMSGLPERQLVDDPSRPVPHAVPVHAGCFLLDSHNEKLSVLSEGTESSFHCIFKKERSMRLWISSNELAFATATTKDDNVAMSLI